MTEPVVSLRGVRAELGSRPVLRGIDLTVHRGEVVALLGANGSGKSTAIRTHHRPGAGHATARSSCSAPRGARFRDWARVGLRPAAHHRRGRRARDGDRDRLLRPPVPRPLRRAAQGRPRGRTPGAGAGRHGGPREGLRERPLRRPAPAGTDRPRARRRTRTADHGRADGGRGPGQPGGAGPHAQRAGRPGHDGPARPARTGPAGAPDRPGGRPARRLRRSTTARPRRPSASTRCPATTTYTRTRLTTPNRSGRDC